ncbi:MAG: hypothetical protein GXX85_00500 [Ignavibacteria bacterium]|nr:hypothetical protein [Ignavibacteria bacterium]
MKISRLNLYEGTTKTKAFLDIETEEGITIKGFTLVEGSNGLFLSAPSEKGKDGKYYDKVYIPKELKENVTALAIEEYNRQKGGSNTINVDNNDDVPF